MPQHILGLSAFYHDSAACLLRDGEIVAAAQEERFTRKKGDASYPTHAVAYCLQAAGIAARDLDVVGFYDKPLLKFERLLETYLGVAPRGYRQFLKAGPVWVKEKLFIERDIRKALGFEGELLFAEHHESHAASAFLPSPFEEAAILTIDGVGEWATASIGVGEGSDLRILREMRWPDSVGLLYSAFTYFAGFKVNSGEYKVMGLAPYGEPRFVQVILDELIDLREDGSFRMNQSFFDYLSGLHMTNGSFSTLFGGPPREPESKLTQREMDLARSVQVVCEEIMLRMARTAHRVTGSKNLCMAGGVALNCVANGRILREGPFENLWIQPAAGDAGGALGVALLARHRTGGRPDRTVVAGRDAMRGSYLGPSFSDDQIEVYLQSIGAVFERLDRDALLERTAEALAQEKIVGWFNGRMEFGPRALGARSILGDPRSAHMQATMNLKIKFRESFRPFAPSVLRERVSEWFELDCDSPYMLLVAPIRQERQIDMTEGERDLWGIEKLNIPRSDIPAVTHVDYSARIQTVDRDTNPDYYDLIATFERRTGCPVIVNTSFNVRGEPIVCTPADAYRCFMRTHIDYLVLGNFFMGRESQPAWQEEGDWRKEFQLD
ncbi:MAG TPA: carbamoyltransferase [Longimicrobiales bacterium]|nr:carbamoyltransferase [Longimicrobiales bacterium]